MGKKSLFDEQFSSEKLEEIGNLLTMISKVIDFKMFIDLLESKLTELKQKKQCKSKTL